jgi:phenylpyruvate tautomerase PptA (4-oxalocrotonate tautomerase family)
MPAAQIMTGRSTFSKFVFRSTGSICQAKQGLIRDFTRVVLAAEGSDDRPENARRVWVTINELKAEDWGIGAHVDWLRDYITALDEVGDYKAPT